MKLLPLLLLICLVGNGQVRDTTDAEWNTTIGHWVKIDTAIAGKYLWAVDSIVIKYDTVRVVMLVCDTSEMQVGTNSIFQPVYGKNYFTRWDFGYMVRIYSYPHSYLDDRRKPLQKSVIVWMVRPAPLQ